MKILFLNMLPDSYVYGHRNVDIKIIKALSSFSELYVMTSREGLDHNELKGVRVIETSDVRKRRKTEYYFTCLKKIYESYKLDKIKKFDYIFFASFDEYCLFFLTAFFRKFRSKVFIIYRNNIDSIDTLRRKKILFQQYCKYLNHIVFEEFQREHLIENYKIKPEKVSVLPYPMRDKLPQRKKEFDFVAISNSNDEDWIHFLIENEKKTEYLKTKKLQLVFRSRQETFDNGNLHVIKGYLESDKYNHYISGARVLFVPYPSTFRYRMSGVMIDAFSNDIRIVGTNIPLFRIYEKRYPEICRTIDSLEEFLSVIDNLTVCEMTENFQAFKTDHSMYNVIKTLKKILKLKDEDL